MCMCPDRPSVCVAASGAGSESGGGDSPRGGGDVSVTTACLAAAVCQLLGNLVSLSPHDALLCISRQQIPQQLIRCAPSSYVHLIR